MGLMGLDESGTTTGDLADEEPQGAEVAMIGMDVGSYASQGVGCGRVFMATPEDNALIGRAVAAFTNTVNGLCCDLMTLDAASRMADVTVPLGNGIYDHN
jgi:hypothetical protein